MMSIAMKYFIYCRVSSDREDKQVLGVGSQKKELLEYAKKNNLNVVGLFVEEKSAYKPGRPKFNEMLQRIEKGEADGILVWHLTRIARNSLDGGKVIYMMDEGQIKEIQTKERVYKNTSDDKFLMQIHFAMSKKSSDDTSAFVKRDILAKLEKGEFPGVVPEGYLNINKDGVISGKRYDLKKQELLSNLDRPLNRVEIDPILGSLYRKFFDLALTGVHGINSLREEGYKLGIRGRISGKKLSKQSVVQVLKNPFYYGKFIYEGHLWQGSHEPIITEGEFEKIQSIMAERSRPKFRKRQYALSMIVHCDECKGLMSGDYQKGNAYYRCAHAKGKDAVCTNGKYYREDFLERQVVEVLEKIEIPEAITNWALKQVKKAYQDEITHTKKSEEQNQRALNNVKQQLRRLTERWLSPENADGLLLSDAEYRSHKNDLKSEETKLEKLLQDGYQEENHWTEKCEQFFELSRRIVSKYRSSTVTDKRILLHAVGSKFILKEGQLTIELQKPFSYVYQANASHKSIRTAKNSLNKPQEEVCALKVEDWYITRYMDIIYHVHPKSFSNVRISLYHCFSERWIGIHITASIHFNCFSLQ